MESSNTAATNKTLLDSHADAKLVHASGSSNEAPPATGNHQGADFEISILLLGDSGVGKTTLISHEIKNSGNSGTSH